MVLALEISLLVLAVFFALDVAGVEEKSRKIIYGGMSIVLFTLLIICIITL